MHLVTLDLARSVTTAAGIALLVGALGVARAAEPPPQPAEEARAEHDALAIVALGDPPSGPSAALTDLVHQLRMAFRERSTAVLSARELRERLRVVGRTQVPELERAYAAAQAAFQADEIDTALRLLREVVSELERSPESVPAYDLWLRAQVRIALAERSAGNRAGMVAAIERVLALEPEHALDEDQYAPSFRREFEEVRRVAARAERHELTIRSPAGGLVAYVDGKEVGAVPARVPVPAGQYRITAATLPGDGTDAAVVRTAAVLVEVGDSDREVVLDAALPQALRVEGGPGLAVDRGGRPAAAVGFGRWVSAARVVAVETLREPERQLLVASIYDVATGALVRDVRARVTEGSVAPAVVGVIASYLLGGDSPVVPGPLVRRGTTLLLEGDAVLGRAPPPRWLRPSAYAAAALAAGVGLFAALQARSSATAYGDAGAMVRSDGALVPGIDRARYEGALAAGDGARRNAVVGAAGAAALAMGAAVLGYFSLDARGPPVAGFRF